MIRGILIIVLSFIWFIMMIWPIWELKWKIKKKTKKEKIDDFNKELDKLVKTKKK
jgi:hypothetical protein